MKVYIKIIALFLLCAPLSAAPFQNKTDVNGKDVSFLKEFFMGVEKYLYLNEVKLETSTTTGGLKTRDSTILYNPEERTGGVQTYCQTMYYNFLFKEEDRKLLKEAYTRYQEDFREKRLIRSNKKSSSLYGKGKCKEDFGNVKGMMQYSANTNYTVGYRFHKKSPYFTITIKGVPIEKKGTYGVKESITVTLHFTRSQAKDFVESLDQENFVSLQEEYDDNLRQNKETLKKEKDAYLSKNVIKDNY